MEKIMNNGYSEPFREAARQGDAMSDIIRGLCANMVRQCQ